MSLNRWLVAGVVFLTMNINVNANLNSSNSARGYYVTAKKFLSLIENKNSRKVLQSYKDQVLVQLDDNERDALINKVHDASQFCAGVVDVTTDYKQYKGKKANFLRDFMAEAPQNLLEDYAIKFDAATRGAIKNVNSDRYEQFLRKYISFADRYGKSETGRQASQLLKSKLEEIAKENQRNDISVHEVETGGNYLQNTVYAKIPGSDASLPGALIGGHMDTLPTNKPGADDDASGAVAVLEAYNAVLESGLKFKRDLYFVFYAAEEMGLVGSRVMAKEFKAKNVELRGVLQFDMVGYKSDDENLPMHFIADFTSDPLTAFVKNLAVHYLGLKTADLGSSKCGYACSDHASWDRQGYPAAFPFESSFEHYNKDIHTSHDDMSKVNLEHAMRFVRLGVSFAVEMAEPK